VIACAREPLIVPEATYEVTGFVPGVCFPVGCLCDAATGRIAMYYGAADTFTALCFCNAPEIVEFIRKNPLKR
jgi:beta-1,4-mannooligosaccharide/beta-1,4-mannosyl-N-acetylglucosamine phosphorylase